MPAQADVSSDDQDLLEASRSGSESDWETESDDESELINRIQKMIQQTPSKDPDFVQCQVALASVLARRYREGKQLTDLDSAVQEAADLIPAAHPHHIEQLEGLAAAFAVQYKWGKERLGNIPHGVSAFNSRASFELEDKLREMIQGLPRDDPKIPEYQNLLGKSFAKKYRHGGDLKELDVAIKQFQESVDHMPFNHPDRRDWLYDLGVSLIDRYDRLGNLQDLVAALRAYQELTPADHPDRAGPLYKLGGSFADRLGDIRDLEEELRTHQEMEDVTPADEPDRATRLHQLAGALRTQYQRFNNKEESDEAWESFYRTSDMKPAARAKKLHNLAVLFTHRYQRWRYNNDLLSALRMSREVVELTPEFHPDRAKRLHSLAVLYIAQYQRRGNLDDLQVALHIDQEAVDLFSMDNPHRADHLQHLTTSLLMRYERLGDLMDLDTALNCGQEAMNLTTVKHPDRADRLRALATSFRYRYMRFGDLKDLETTLHQIQEAVKITVDHPDHANQLTASATSFGHRYRRFGDLNDLEAALLQGQEAVKITPADHPDRAERLHNLAVSLLNHYQRLEVLKDLESALHHGQEALDSTPMYHPNRAIIHPDRAERLHNLATCHRYRFKRFGDPKDLEAALNRGQEAVNITPVNHPDHANRLHNLGVSFADRYLMLGDEQDLEVALSKYETAISLTPTDHPERAKLLQAFAWSCSARYKISRKTEDLHAVHTHYSDSFKIQALSDPETLYYGALHWASFAEKFQPTDASTAYSAAFEKLPEILWMGQTIPVRHEAVRRLDLGCTASAAARSCIKHSDLTSAVQFIEQSIATIFQQMLQLKPDFALLSPWQAKQLQELSLPLYRGEATDPIQMARERKELIEDIRKQPGLEFFLRPKPYKDLCCASQKGPIVILNSHADACDGIIIPNPTLGPLHAAFPYVTSDLLQSKRNDLKRLLFRCGAKIRGDSESTRANDHREGFSEHEVDEDFKDLLTWLWKNIIDVVYQTLASHGIEGGRIWWLPTGLFTGLPLHASTPKNDQFIHSYTATLGSLIEGQARGPARNPLSMGVVGVTHTGPGRKGNLPYVRDEVKKIKSIIQSHRVEFVVGKTATPDAVKSQLLDFSWLHLACHGTQDLTHPTKSRLLLYERDLELETILQMPLSNSEFVFLAACQTAMGDAELVNESFHLGGGFIAAGFRGAIGTMWSIDDQDGPLVAESVYSHLFRDSRQPEASDAAEALHLAVNELRARGRPYRSWVPFIHMGV
ncbi:CHAT domain-containing protein [Mycena galericulata]|nr:CHAT domain-containing protein [Mycena galericulata]